MTTQIGTRLRSLSSLICLNPIILPKFVAVALAVLAQMAGPVLADERSVGRSNEIGEDTSLGLAASEFPIALGAPLYSPDLQTLVDEAVRGSIDSENERVRELSEQLGVHSEALLLFLEIIGNSGVPPEMLADTLSEITAMYARLLEQLTGGAEPRVVALQKKAAAALEEGDFEQADAFLAEAIELEELLAGLDQRAATAANIRAQRGELALVQLRYSTAAQHFRAAAETVSEGDDEAQFKYLLRQAEALLALGTDFGDNLALIESIVVLRKIFIKAPREGFPLRWAEAQSKLGDVLTTLGERELAASRLEEAVAAYRAALEERTQERVPLDWAETQSNLGNALAELGVRESGTARLGEAVAAYRAALEERTRERVPLDWAETQSNLGNALAELGVRKSGTARLEEAVAAYRAALEERTRERVPLDWAETQSNLGNALAELGVREPGTARLEEAVAAYRAALEERTRERVPLDWAIAQNNLGNALLTLGQHRGERELLEEALVAYYNAAEEFTRERVPLQWASTQKNLGTALLTIGLQEGDTQSLKSAVEAYNGALSELTRDRNLLEWAATQNNLGNTLLTLGQQKGDIKFLESAVEAYESALREMSRDTVPLQWAATQNNLGNALAEVGVRLQDPERLQNALQAFNSARSIYVVQAGYTDYENYFSEQVSRIEGALRFNECGQPEVFAMNSFVESLKQFKEIIAFCVLIVGITLGALQYFVSKNELESIRKTLMSSKDIENLIKCLQLRDDRIRSSFEAVAEIDNAILSVVEEQQASKLKLVGELGIKTYQLESVGILNVETKQIRAIGGVISFAPTNANERQIEEVIRLEKLESRKQDLRNARNERITALKYDNCF